MRLFGLIGYPLGHSFSQKFFSEKFRSEGLTDCEYRNFPITSIDMLPALIREEADLCGFNVTIPYKIEVKRYLDSLDTAAETIGAVNVVKVNRKGDDIKLKGYNTDAPAFRMTLEKEAGDSVKTALILGSGGASAAVDYVLREMGVRVKKISRKPAHERLSYNDLTPSLLKSVELIVNATPVGMFPDILECPAIDYSALDSHHILYDLIYNPLKTEFLKRGEARGCKIINGLDMLHLQAEFAWKIWNNSGLR